MNLTTEGTQKIPPVTHVMILPVMLTSQLLFVMVANLPALAVMLRKWRTTRISLVMNVVLAMITMCLCMKITSLMMLRIKLVVQVKAAFPQVVLMAALDEEKVQAAVV